MNKSAGIMNLFETVSSIVEEPFFLFFLQTYYIGLSIVSIINVFSLAAENLIGKGIFTIWQQR